MAAKKKPVARKKAATKKTPAAAATPPEPPPAPPPPRLPNRIPDETIRELELLLEHAKDARGAYTDAVKAQAIKYELNKAGLARYVAARVADTLAALRAEVDTFDQLALFEPLAPVVMLVESETGEVLESTEPLPNLDPKPDVDLDVDCPTCGLPGGIDTSVGETCPEAECPYMAGSLATVLPMTEEDDDGPRTIDGKKPISDVALAAMPVVGTPLNSGGSDRGAAAERLGDDQDPRDLMSDESVVV